MVATLPRRLSTASLGFFSPGHLISRYMLHIATGHHARGRHWVITAEDAASHDGVMIYFKWDEAQSPAATITFNVTTFSRSPKGHGAPLASPHTT